MIQDSMSAGSCLVLAGVGVKGDFFHDSRELRAVGILIPPACNTSTNDKQNLTFYQDVNQKTPIGNPYVV